MKNFQEELESLINKHSIENGSNTPDFILAEYLTNCLKSFNSATIGRELWYNSEQHIKSKEEQMKEFFLPFLNNLELITDKTKFPYSVFYKQNGKVIFEHYQNGNDNYFFVRYYGVWSVFGEKFNLNYQQISDFIKGVVESVLNLKGVTPGSVEGKNKWRWNQS